MKIDISKWQTVKQSETWGEYTIYELQLTEDVCVELSSSHIKEDIKHWDIYVNCINPSFQLYLYDKFKSCNEEEAKEKALLFVLNTFSSILLATEQLLPMLEKE